ncbi:hypothetical protein CEUSTIGMA_g2367.t1 [Chlamydomonas eustigma]|uniref:Thioredoxin domain-containing protein n=1 Tax=Chlamydomonas eustigma TaxID=1157962 RepID=A0A250WVS8_9CHLO|nr:hypothetical protein CEUSTIGMA_g2367.t1 [Chlamydomonas eustigma]|eukprot:GAX74921.1 hypothetical protein CEUSTIGMA_g2367.t1 [Chlamydomonas eustigma]
MLTGSKRVCSVSGAKGSRIRNCNVQAFVSRDRETIAAMTVMECETVIELTAHNIQSFLSEHQSQLTVVDFYTPWCGPCKVMASVLEQMAHEHNDVNFIKFDCGADTNNKNFAISVGIKALPTFILYRGSEKIAQVTGAKAEKLREMVRTLST